MLASSSDPLQASWHTLLPVEVLSTLQTSATDGLPQQEAETRRALYGPNQLREGKRVNPLRMFLAQFQNILVVILLVGTALSAFLGHGIEAITIGVIVLLAVTLGFVQEFRAERAMEALKSLAAPTSSVIRGGEEHEIAAVDLVPGDIILLSTGDRVPADARLLEAVSLRVEESALTGESLPTEKASAPLQKNDIPLGDRVNMVYAGTSVSIGRGRAAVVATGMHTQFGAIARMLGDIEEQETPLQRNLDRLGRTLAKVALGVVAAISIAGYFQGQELVDLLIFGVALAVAVVPEALPAVVTVSLAIGVQRMVRRNALIRKLHAVETLGCTSVICTDKTGTLTKDEMTLRQAWVAGTLYEVSGTGYSPTGDFSVAGAVIEPTEGLREILRGGVLSSDAKIVLAESGHDIHGDPTEGAFVVAAAKIGLHRQHLDAAHPRVAEIPFSSETKRMTTLHGHEEHGMAYSKGAVEAILPLCTRMWGPDGERGLTDADRREILAIAERMASKALRVLAVARKGGTDLKGSQFGKKFLGLVGMIDPPRPEARAAIATAKAAGIDVIMITGDHHVTARAIAGELGIPPSDGAVLTGQEIDALDDLGFDAAVRRATVFARVSPHHKLRIVAALQRQGKVVAMTGDGVNDAPALKKADIGVAMGITGTDVTKEAAVMTLTDDNFASIVAAVEEGRAIFGNIKKYLMYLLSSNVGEILIMTVATLMGWPMPLTAVQLLYLNLATDGFPALALAVDPPVSDLMLRPPRDPRSGVFARRSLILMLAGSVWLAILTLGMFLYAWNSDMDHTEARTFAFVLIVVTELVKAYNFRSDRLSAFIRPFSNRWLNLAILWEIVLLLCVIYIPFFHVPFGTRALHLHDWALIVPAALSMIPVLEVIKWILRLASGRAARVSSNLHKSAAPIIPSCSDKLQRCSISMEESAPPEVSRSE